MMLLVWTKTLTGRVYPTLWYSALPAKGEGEPGTLASVVSSHKLTKEQEKAIDALPAGVSHTDAAAAFYPLQLNADEADKAVDSPPTMREVFMAIDGAVANYRHRMRAFDGQSAQIDKENAR